MRRKKDQVLATVGALLTGQQPGEQLTRERRVERAKTDFQFFCTYYLANYFFSQPAPFHLELAGLFRFPRVAVAAPREHAKSTLVFAHMLHQICTKSVHFIVVFRYPDSMAVQTVADLREELASNERIIADFGELVADKSNLNGRRRKWAEGHLVTSTDICVRALGRNSGARGLRHRQWRPDLVLVDDIEDDSSVQSKEQRTKLERWFRRVASNVVSRDGKLFVVGTILHTDSLLANLLTKSEVYVTRKWAATPEAPLWPAQWPAKRLAEKRAEIGAREFATEFGNDPRNEEDQIFPASGWHYYDDDEIKGLRLDIVGAIDPAIGLKAKNDETALAVVGEYRHPHGGRTIYVLDCLAKRVRPQEQVRLAFAAKRKWPRMASLGVEAIAYQQALLEMIRTSAAAEGIQLNAMPVEDIASDKIRRISRLAAMVERGDIRFPDPRCKHWSPDVQKCLDQFERLGVDRSGHDDLPDAVERAIALLDRGRQRQVRASIL